MRTSTLTRRCHAAVVAVCAVAGATIIAAPSAVAADQSVTVAVPIASFAAAAAAAGATPEASPSGVNGPCKPSKAHPYPIVLVNGTFTVMLDSFGYLGPSLANAGYCVYGYNYGGPRNQPVQATGPVLDGVDTLATEVKRVLKQTGAMKVDLVGYSQGGLITELFTKYGGAASVHSVTALAPTTHGTTLLGIGTLATQVPGAVAALRQGCAACADQLQGSSVIKKNTNGPIAVKGIRYTVIDTVLEDVVTPTGSSFIDEPGVVNQYVQDYSTVNTDEHITLPFDPVTLDLTLRALKRAGS